VEIEGNQTCTRWSWMQILKLIQAFSRLNSSLPLAREMLDVIVCDLSSSRGESFYMRVCGFGLIVGSRDD
jgi:hypothetical protein